jgi:hypothetical protein
MKVRNTNARIGKTGRVCTTLLAAMLTFAGCVTANAQEQKRDHAVTPGQLRQDVQKAADTRQANEAEVRKMFASDQAKEQLKSAGIDYKQVDRAISQVDDEDLARMADRAQEVNSHFAAGNLGDRDLLIILVVAVVIILIIVAVR